MNSGPQCWHDRQFTDWASPSPKYNFICTTGNISMTLRNLGSLSFFFWISVLSLPSLGTLIREILKSIFLCVCLTPVNFLNYFFLSILHVQWFFSSVCQLTLWSSWCVFSLYVLLSSFGYHSHMHARMCLNSHLIRMYICVCIYYLILL